MWLFHQLAVWRARRRRFAEEWAFHRDLTISDLQSMGVDPREARRIARQRLGSYPFYRRAALRELHFDLPFGFRRGPYFLPCAILLALLLLLLFNPQRVEALRSIGGLLPFVPAKAVVHWVPLTPRGVVPTGFAGLVLWPFLAAGMLLMASRLGAHRRLLLFGMLLLVLMAAMGAVCWATGLQMLLHSRWRVDPLQGVAVMVFGFAFVGSMAAAFRFLFRDLARRCPVCLTRLGMADSRGNRHDVLVWPRETETICLHGHGLNLETRWGRVFQEDPSGNGLLPQR